MREPFSEFFHPAIRRWLNNLAVRSKLHLIGAIIMAMVLIYLGIIACDYFADGYC